jgi:hypothetical protein
MILHLGSDDNRCRWRCWIRNPWDCVTYVNMIVNMKSRRQ